MKIALRHLWKNKLFSALNLVGLTIGLASIMTLLFGVYAFHSADDALKGREELYYLKTVGTNGESFMQTTYPLLGEIVNSSPKVKAATHIQGWNSPWLEYNGNEIQKNTRYVDTSFFKVFNLPFKFGDPENALRDKYSVVISNEVSKQLFGEINPVGKTVKADDSLNLTITGVLEPISSYSYIDADILLTSELLFDIPGFKENANWYSSFAENFLRLHPNTDIEVWEENVREIVARNYVDDSGIEKIRAVPFNQLRRDYNPTVGTIIDGSIATAIFVLLIVLVNLLNLNSSIMFGRTKEVAVRKIMGSGKQSIVWQFCIENALLVFTSLFLAGLLFLQVLQPQMNQIYGSQFGKISFNMGHDYPVLLLYLGLGLFITLIVGIIPTLKYISLPVSQAIKGMGSTITDSFLVRNFFITLQFSLAIIFICVAIILNSQIGFMKNVPLGFNEKNVSLVNIDLVYENKEAAESYFESLLNKLRSNPYVENFSTTGMVPSDYSYNYNTYYDPETQNEIHFRHTGADAGYLKTFEISLVTGRDFDEQLNAAENNSVIINQEAMKALGWKNLDNKQLVEKGGGEPEVYNVIGVMEDFHYQGMQHRIEPLLHWYNGKSQLGYNSYLSLRIAEGHTHQVLEGLKKEFKMMPTKRDFEVSPLAQKISGQYSLMEGILKTVNFVASLTILIACLGMFGLISLNAKKRVKEIGIRRTLGAGVSKIAILLSKDFIKLVLLASLLAFPLVWWIMDTWLQDFAYRIDIKWWMFVLGGSIALLITAFTVGIRSFKAASANPVKSLRTE